MKTHIRQRQLRGLVLHHRRHPADHPRRLVNRTARWGEPPQNGICRWCYERTAHIKTRWHPYCLNAYRVASGQHPEEIQHTLCEICGGPSDEMDHRLAINVARALGPAAMLRAFTLDNLRWLCRSCHRRKTRQDRRLAKFLAACSLDWYSVKKLLRETSQVGADLHAAVQPGACSAEWDFGRRSVRRSSARENPAQQGKRQPPTAQHEILRAANQMGQSLSDR